MRRTAFSRVTAAALTVVDFDGTLAQLHVNWTQVKARLAQEAASLGTMWNMEDGLDVNLRRIRHQISPTIFDHLCRLISRHEIEAFKSVGIVHHHLLNALLARGDRPVAVFSANTRSALMSILSEPCFVGFNPYLIAKEDVTKGKPDPEGLLAVCGHYAIEPEDSLYIGDTEYDRAAASAAGVEFICARELQSTTNA